MPMWLFRKSRLVWFAVACALGVGCGLALSPSEGLADVIDIYSGLSAGNADMPNIIFLVDNSPNWSRAAQHWPDNGGIQGAAELAAIKSELDLIGSTPPQIQASVGLAMLSSYAGSSATAGTPA